MDPRAKWDLKDLADLAVHRAKQVNKDHRDPQVSLPVCHVIAPHNVNDGALFNQRFSFENLFKKIGDLNGNRQQLKVSVIGDKTQSHYR